MKEVLIALNQQPIAVYPIYIDITGSVTAGLLLSQIMYWNAKMKGKEFYKNDTEYMEETRLTQSEFKTAKKIVSGLSFLKIERKGAPYRTYYSVDHDELFVVLQRFSSSFTYELGSRLSTSQRGVNLRTIIGTENTQEITSENTAGVEKEFSTVLIDEVDETNVEIHHVPEWFDESYFSKKEMSEPDFWQKIKETDESEYTLLSDISKATQKKERKSCAKKKENPAPTRPMFQYYEQKYAELNKGELPIWQDKYARPLKDLFNILTARCAQKGIVQFDPLQPWKDFIDMWSQYLIDHPKETWHRDNFNPMALYSQFNSIISKLNAQPAKVQSERMDKWEKWAKQNGVV